MVKIDVSCMVGHWPFRKIRRKSFEDLRKIHEGNGISSGFVSSLDSIFYHDPFEGDEELHNILKGTAYKHVLTVHPNLPYFSDDIAKGIELFDIMGVRIYPGYHRYSPDSREFQTLCGILKKAALPLFLTLRMEDERLEYIVKSRAFSTDDIAGFIKASGDNVVIISNIRYRELLALKDVIGPRENVFFDTSGLKDELFVIEKLLDAYKPEKILYGSLHPMLCLKSTLLLVEMAQVEDNVKEKILSGNAMAIIKQVS